MVTLRRSVIWSLVAAGLVVTLILVPAVREEQTWFSITTPGPVSHAHSHFANDCNACHTPWRGVEDQSCIACHANDRDLLQSQPTAFHKSVGNCKVCHPEHTAWPGIPTLMDHAAFARIGLEKLTVSGTGTATAAVGQELQAWVFHRSAENSEGVKAGTVTAEEAVLDCAACHGNEDLHNSLFGRDCAACHTTSEWSLSGFRHPSQRSRSCAQCHQAPPSHYMMHFKMVSAKVAREPHADVRQCFICHQTNSWNDIKNVGFYKHH